MAQIVEIPGVGRVDFPDTATPEEIKSLAARLHANRTEVRNPRPTRSMLVPPGPARSAFETLLGPLPDSNPSGFRRETLPTIGATLGSMMVPGGAVVRGLPLLSRLARLLPGVAAAGAGGATGGLVGGLLGDEDPIGAGLSGGARMAGAEVLGRGAAGLGARLLAPALGLLDDTGRQALRFSRENVLPEERTGFLGRSRRPGLSPALVAPGVMQRGAQNISDLLIPSRLSTQSSRRVVTERVLGLRTDQQNELLARLIGADTSDASLTTAKDIADRIAKRLGMKQARALGYESREGPRAFLGRLFREGDPASLRQSMGRADFNLVLEKGVEALIIGASRRTSGGRRIVDGESLWAAWENLPAKVRDLYPPKVREAIENFAAFARASSRVPELSERGVLEFGPVATSAGIGVAAGVPAIAGLTGEDGSVEAGAITALGGGVAGLTAKSLMKPTGWLNRYLTSERLPPDIARVAGRELTKLFPRNWLAEPPEDNGDE